MIDDIVIGIDPGIGGAIVVLQDGDPVEWTRMPTVQEGKAKRVDCAEVAKFLQYFDEGVAYIERVHAMPGQGVSSMFSFGHAVGSIMGVVATLGIPMTTVTPQAWKRSAGLIGADKDAARSRARQIWPMWDALGKKGEGQALADAALIARFGGG